MPDRRRPGSPMRQVEPQEAAHIDDVRKTA